MMKRKKIGLLVLVAALCFVAPMTGCAKESEAPVIPNYPGPGTIPDDPGPGTIPDDPGPGTIPDDPGPGTIPDDPKRLASVTESGIRITENVESFIIEWNVVPNATTYELRSGVWSAVTSSAIYSLRTASGPEFPASGEITFTIIAKAEGYTDSTPTTKTYRTEGVQLSKPEIMSAENGIIEWTAVTGAKGYTVKVDGTVVSAAQQSRTYDASEITDRVEIEITAVGDGIWIKNSESVKAIYSGNGISPIPAGEYEVDGEILRWGAVEGVTEYRVVDLDFNIIIVDDTAYDMSGRNLVYGVYPVTDPGAALEFTPADIEYLEGEGTASSPYLIKTPFDLRAIDYYETLRAETNGDKIYYRLENDIDYNEVDALDDESNIFTLHKPFFGVLDGNGKKLANIKVNYDGGYWSLFDFIASGATVKDLIVDKPEITNMLQDAGHPLNSAIAAIAHFNYGTVSGITLTDAKFQAQAGVISGIVSRNYGTVSGCTVAGEFTQLSTAASGGAAYEMAGVVLENLSGGTVSGNTVSRLILRGTGGNISSAGGVVSINRAGGTVSGNSFGTVQISGMVVSGMGAEYGGVVAYNAGSVVKGAGRLGTLTVDGTTVAAEVGTASSARGKLIGKNDGTRG